MNRHQLGWLFWGLSLLILIPGLTQPLMSITGTIDRQQLAELGRDAVLNSPNMVPMFKGMVTTLVNNLDLNGSVMVYDKTRSILGTVADLWRSGNEWVAILIVTFSVIIPFTKAVLVVISLWLKHAPHTARVLRVNALLSKWSMTDVYVMAILVAYLAVATSTQGSGQNLLQFDARFGSGFWFFLGFCLLSIVSSHLMAEKAASA